MVRKLFSILFAAIALAALAGTSAQAAEFHCSVEPCRVTVKPDGTGKTAHQILWVHSWKGDSVGFTCDGMSGEATQAKTTSTQLTITNIEYQNCRNNGVPSGGIKMNGCDYLIGSTGLLTIKCPVGAKAEWHLFGCTVTFGEQGPLSAFAFHDAGSSKSELTMQGPVKGILGWIDEGPECVLNNPGPFEGEIQTGNVILTAETDNEAAVMANIWWE